jgi:hypothetical protein
MDGRGWKPEYGISAEGVKILGFVEALPRDVRQELLDEVERRCRRAGFYSLHDRLGAAEEEERIAKVIPLFPAKRSAQ